MSEYNEVRDNLIDMLEDLDKRLSKITEDVRHTDEPLSKDFEEQAVQTENDEVLDFLGNATRLEIEKIKQAINRIDQGMYGICENCGEPINQARLKALPFSGMCIKCATALEEHR